MFVYLSLFFFFFCSFYIKCLICYKSYVLLFNFLLCLFSHFFLCSFLISWSVCMLICVFVCFLSFVSLFVSLLVNFFSPLFLCLYACLFFNYFFNCLFVSLFAPLSFFFVRVTEFLSLTPRVWHQLLCLVFVCIWKRKGDITWIYSPGYQSHSICSQFGLEYRIYWNLGGLEVKSYTLNNPS